MEILKRKNYNLQFKIYNAYMPLKYNQLLQYF